MKTSTINFNKKFLLASDVDFSFLGWEWDERYNIQGDLVPNDNIVAVKNLFKNKNFNFCFATGSNPTLRIANLMRLVGMNGLAPAILNNGSLIVEYNLEEDFDYKILSTSEIVSGEKVISLARDFSKRIIDFEKYNSHIVKVFLEKKEGYEKLDSYTEFLKLAKKERLSVYDYGTHLDITSEMGTKREGVEKLRKMLGIERDQVIVFGDGANDSTMMKGFKNSFCPKDASLIPNLPSHTTILKRKHREGCIMEIVKRIGYKI